MANTSAKLSRFAVTRSKTLTNLRQANLLIGKDKKIRLSDRSVFKVSTAGPRCPEANRRAISLPGFMRPVLESRTIEK